MAETTTKAPVTSKLYTEIFRPQTLDQAVIVPRIKEELNKGLVDNLMFVGTQGAGKTTLTRIMCKNVDSHNILEINASLERGIDTIRDQVMAFCSSSSLFAGVEQFKVVVLEECDGLTYDAWASLRALIEKYHKTVRFIANCNYVDKVPEPIQSRFNVIIIDPINKDEEDYLFAGYVERLKYILDYLHISYTEDNIKVFVKNSFPDMRSLIKKVQQLVTRGCSELSPDMLSTTFDCSALFNLILSKPDPWSNYKTLVGEWSNKAEDAVLNIGKQFPEYLNTVAPQHIAKLPMVLIATAEYNSMLATSLDKFVTLLGLVFKLQVIINS